MNKDKTIPTNPEADNGRLKQLDHAAEALIVGDSDDAPLSDEAVTDMLKRTQND